MDVQLDIDKCQYCEHKLVKELLMIVPECVKHNGDFEYVPSKDVVCYLCKYCNQPILPEDPLYKFKDKVKDESNISGRINTSNNKWKNYFILDNQILSYQLKDVKINNYIVYFIVVKLYKKSYVVYVSNFLTDKEKMKVKKKENCIIS